MFKESQFNNIATGNYIIVGKKWFLDMVNRHIQSLIKHTN